MLAQLGRHARGWAQTTPWTNVLGLARSLLALCTLGTLVASSPSSLFPPALYLGAAPFCAGPARISLFCLADPTWLPALQFVGVIGLLVVVSGWRPRITAVPHWWIANSFAVSSTLPDGGDQAAAVLTFLLLPLALTDPRRWHWDTLSDEARESIGPVVVLVALASWTAVRLQVSGIYFHSSLAKLAVPEWVDGTAIFYWLNDPFFGPALWLRGPLVAVAATGVGSVLLTWGAIMIEFTLALALVMGRRWWPPLLIAGIAFHSLIALWMGLISFALAMFGALVLYLRPLDAPFSLPRWLARPIFGRRWSPALRDQNSRAAAGQ